MWHHHHHHGGWGWGGPGYYGGWGYHPHYHYGGGGLWPFLGGMVAGSVVANAANSTPRTVVYEQQPSVVYQTPPSAIDYQARAEAQAARASADMALRQQSSPQSQPGLMLVKVRVPQGVSPGQVFAFTLQDRQFRVMCPSNAMAGQEIYTYVPISPDMAMPVVEGRDIASVGRDLVRTALNGGGSASQSVPAIPKIRAVLVKDHVIDENALENIEHNIVSGKKGDVVEVLEGTLEDGMMPPYEEYCLVRFASGKTGKVSRFLLQPNPAPSVPPPRAMT